MDGGNAENAGAVFGLLQASNEDVLTLSQHIATHSSPVIPKML